MFSRRERVLNKILFFVSVFVLSLPLFSHDTYAESKRGTTSESTHALATIAPAGRWFIQVEARSISYNSAYDNEGNNKPLGSALDAINLNAAVFPLLALFPAGSSLGTTSISAEVASQFSQITLGYGVTEHLTVGVITDFGKNKNSVNFAVAGGNVGWNPAFNPAAPPSLANIPFAPVGAGATQAMNAADINTILSNPAFGYGYQPIQSTTVSGVGSVLLGALWRFYEGESDSLVAGFGVRTSLSGAIDPDSISKIPLNDGSTDVIAQVEYFRQIASIFDMRLMLKRTVQLSDKVTSRVAAPGQVLAFASSKESLDRNLGDIWEYNVEAGVSLDNWRISSTWYRYLKKADHYYSARGQNVSSLIRNTALRGDYWRVGISWSGIEAFLQKTIPIPLIVKFEMQDTINARNLADQKDYYLQVTTLF